jgi:hypothetical protein
MQIDAASSVPNSNRSAMSTLITSSVVAIAVSLAGIMLQVVVPVGSSSRVQPSQVTAITVVVSPSGQRQNQSSKLQMLALGHRNETSVGLPWIHELFIEISARPGEASMVITFESQPSASRHGRIALHMIGL